MGKEERRGGVGRVYRLPQMIAARHRGRGLKKKDNGELPNTKSTFLSHENGGERGGG